MDQRKEVIFSDIPALVREKEQLSPLRTLYKWEAVPYETRKIKGTWREYEAETGIKLQ